GAGWIEGAQVQIAEHACCMLPQGHLYSHSITSGPSIEINLPPFPPHAKIVLL
ncbi:unnamed protein product, partial [Ascophyllum nodosum]